MPCRLERKPVKEATGYIAYFGTEKQTVSLGMGYDKQSLDLLGLNKGILLFQS